MEEQYVLKRPDCIKNRKRVARGTSSGHGKTGCRGQKGQLSRSGSGKKPGFEGGQMPIQRKVPKRGFTSIFRKYYQIVNLSQIAELGINEINPAVLAEKKIIKHQDKLVKILGSGELKKPVKIVADAFSESAAGSIKNAGGEAVLRKKAFEK